MFASDKDKDKEDKKEKEKETDGDKNGNKEGDKEADDVEMKEVADVDDIEEKHPLEQNGTQIVDGEEEKRKSDVEMLQEKVEKDDFKDPLDNQVSLKIN